MTNSRDDEGYRRGYVAGMLNAADVAHGEARWQLELAGRTKGAPSISHHHACGRVQQVEESILAMAAMLEEPPAMTATTKGGGE